MANVTPAEFRLKYPEFGDQVKYPDGMIQDQIDATLCEISEDIAECFFPRMQCLLVAHFLAMRTKEVAAGGVGTTGMPLASQSEGDLSESYTSENLDHLGSDAVLASTSYGREYLRLRNMNIPRVEVSELGVPVRRVRSRNSPMVGVGFKW